MCCDSAVQRVFPWLLVTAIAVAFAAHLVLQHRDTPQGAQPPAVEHAGDDDSSRDESTPLNEPVYEPPSTELLRLRGEVARLREETNRIAEEWQRSTSMVRSLQTEVVRLHKENSIIERELYALRDMTNTTPRPPRVGAWLGIVIGEARAPDAPPGTQEGVRILDVQRNAPAGGGLREGDIVTAIDDNPVSNTATFKAILATNHAGATFKFTVLRNGDIEVVGVRSTSWPQ